MSLCMVIAVITSSLWDIVGPFSNRVPQAFLCLVYQPTAPPSFNWTHFCPLATFLRQLKDGFVRSIQFSRKKPFWHTCRKLTYISLWTQFPFFFYFFFFYISYFCWNCCFTRWISSRKESVGVGFLAAFTDTFWQTWLQGLAKACHSRGACSHDSSAYISLALLCFYSLN